MRRALKDVQEILGHPRDQNILGLMFSEQHLCSSPPVTAAKLGWFHICILLTLSFLFFPKAQPPLCPLSHFTGTLPSSLVPGSSCIPHPLCGVDMARGPRHPLLFFCVVPGFLPKAPT